MHENAADFRHPAGYSLPRVVAIGLAAACPFRSPRAADPAMTTSTNDEHPPVDRGRASTNDEHPPVDRGRANGSSFDPADRGSSSPDAGRMGQRADLALSGWLSRQPQIAI